MGNTDITEQSKDGQSKGKGSEKGGEKEMKTVRIAVIKATEKKEETANPFSGTNQLATPPSLQSQLLRQTKIHLYRLRSAIYPL